MGRQWIVLAMVAGMGLAVAACGLFAPAPASPSPTATVATPHKTAAVTPTVGKPTIVVQTEATPTPTATATPLPPTATATPTPTATATPLPPTTTATATLTPLPPTATATPTVLVPSSSATLTVNGQSIAYRYPVGWDLRQESKDRYSTVFVDGPDGVFLSLTMYGVEMEPAQLSASLLETMKKQFTVVAVTPLQDTIAGYTAMGYKLSFKHMGVPMTSTVLSFRGGKASFTLYTQAADDDLDVVQPGFDLIKNSLTVK